MRFKLSSDKPEFEGHAPSLKALESSFRKAGLKISFLADYSPTHGKKIHIMEKAKVIKTIYIEGDSPAQTVKDVAAVVKL
jgi:hypothetical protein